MCGLTHQTDSFLALFDATEFLVQEIGGIFGILVIWVMAIFHLAFQYGEGGGKCRYCYQKLSNNRGSTSNMKRHLERKHPTVPLYRDIPPSTSNTQPDTPVVEDSIQKKSEASIESFFRQLNH